MSYKERMRDYNAGDSVPYVGRLEAYALELTKAFTGLMPLGGSELFTGQLRDDDGEPTLFRADIPFILNRLREKEEKYRAAKIREVRGLQMRRRIIEELTSFDEEVSDG